MVAQEYEHMGRMIRAEMRTTVAPQQAWEAWADPSKIAGWFVDRAIGDAKRGGTMTWCFDSFGFVQPLRVVDAVPGSLLVLKWEPPQGQGPAGVVEVRIVREDGETVLQLVNSGFREGAQWDEEYEGTNSGWQIALALLKEYLEHHFACPKRTEMVLRPASFARGGVREYFVAALNMGQWLTKAGTGSGVGTPGDTCRLELRDGRMVTGRVLALTESEVAFSWDEIGGTLELKAFAMGPQRMLGVRVMSWKLDADALKKVAAQLEPAVARLAAICPAAATAAGAVQASATFKKEKR
jgi:uncharacterized protein YndB with AHSA1/START domain